MRSFAVFLGFQAVWWASILGAAAGRSWLGVVVCATLLAAHLWASADRRAELALATTAALAGWALDTALVAADVLSFESMSAVAPAWIAGLWAAFAVTLGVSMRYLWRRPWAAVGLGALSGPVAYLAGERLGAVEIAPNGWPWIALEWGLATPALARLSRRLGTGAPR